MIAAAASSALLPVALAAQSARYLNPREVAEAQQQHAALVEEFGGAETGQRAAYVQSVGQRVAAYSGVANPGQSFRFTTLNSAVENAFAVPGGYIYITRQLMTLMNDESELAFALGHEAGHVAANHAQQRERVQRRNSIYGVFGAILGSVFGSSAVGNLLSQQAQLRTLSFSRQQEYDADRLATQYLARSGYDPAGGPGILAALARSGALEARVQGRETRSTPEWASTHPLSENRARQAQVMAQQTGRLGTGIRNRDHFLAQLDGTYVDDDPAQGVIEDVYFRHPGLRLQFAIPVGFQMQNGTRSVSISGSGGQAEFGGGGYQGPLESYAARVLQELGGGQRIAIAQPERTTINGMPAAVTATRAQAGSSWVDVSVVAYQWDRDTVYHFVMITRAGQGIGPFRSMVNSLRRLTPAEAAAIRPRVVDVVTVRAGDTVQSLASRMAYRSFRLERFLSLNGLAANSALSPGQKVKLVVYGTRRS
ncbi:M48 family metalloprotease [Sphingomonas piscis]|uniref:M48 family metalloprotease n=1 Tax=Sphingomonas piscis TaxID=2714943 RepID=A0A6G7YT13_9SPHN|nr:M48 family metalloprotease [Sphingomonas piscis]